jgi:hypothetical protein
VRSLSDGSEFRISFVPHVNGTSWEQNGRECAVLNVAVDGSYDQHVFLPAGAEEVEYAFVIGPLAQGPHVLEISWNREWTPSLETAPVLKEVVLEPLSDEPALRAPILYMRDDTIGRFSDVPLLVYWETEEASAGPRLVYTVIFSNEDGGTNTERLMARWGRTSDIEWCYAFAQPGGSGGETFQAKDHKTLPFRGSYVGRHPRLHVATQNNNFSDDIPAGATVRVRPWPVPGELKGGSREIVMDRFPWTYGITAREMIREGKIEDPGDPRSARVSDLRNYAYVEVCAAQRGTVLRFELQLLGSDRWYSSDHLDPRARIEREGCFRSTIELPPGTRADQLRTLRVQCLPAPVPEGERPPARPASTVERISRLFLLDSNYRPGPSMLESRIRKELRPGRSLTLKIGH